jgi:hypothetical protein
LVGGKSRRGYYIVDKLKKQKMIRAERVPNAHRSKYLVLTKKGAEQLIDEPKLHEYYVRKELVEDILAENEIYRIIVLSKIEHLMSRKDALEYLKLNPAENGLKWLLKTKGLYAVYLRTSGAKSFIEKSIQNAPRLDGHIIVYTNNKQYRDDRRAWLKRLPGPGIYQVTFDKLPYLLSMFKEPDVHIAEFTQKLAKFVSSGHLIKLKDAPVKYAWQKDGGQMLLCDLTTGNLTGPALIKAYSINELKMRGWGDGVIFYVDDKRTARTWSYLLKHREYNYFITKSDTVLYGVKDGKLVQMAQ